jgi:thiosulfate dehydrogenase
MAAGLLVWNGCSPDTSTPDHSAVTLHPGLPPSGADTVDGSIVPADAAIPAGEAGASIRRGRALLESTRDSLPKYVGNNLRCISCHLDYGRRLKTAPLLGAYARYPRYVDRSGAVISIEERVNYCFTRSLAGRRLSPLGSDMHDIVSYLEFLSTGIPMGAHTRGEGTPPLPEKLAGNPARGAVLYGPTCTRCHGANGGGTMSAPALWGAQSFTIGAGMAREGRAAAFIQRTMPHDKPGTLTDQQAFDLAAFLMSKARPDLPGKAGDWPKGDAPYDVPYATQGHMAYRPPPVIPRTGDTTEMMMPVPASGSN